MCEDQDATIEGVDSILKKSGMKYTLTGVDNAKDALTYLNKKEFQLLILDISLQHKVGNKFKKEDGIELLKNIKARWPHQKVLMMSFHDENYMIKESFDNGALGYLFKSNVTKQLVTAIETVMKGRQYLSPDLQEKYDNFLVLQPSARWARLTKAEKNVAFHLANDETPEQIAKLLGRKSSTIRSQKESIFKKLGVETIQQLKNYLKRHKLK